MSAISARLSSDLGFKCRLAGEPGPPPINAVALFGVDLYIMRSFHKTRGSQVVTKNDVVLGLRLAALMALSAEMKLLWHSISVNDSPGLADPALNLIQD